METSLHRQLKSLYAGDIAACEVRVGGSRTDAIADGRLIEIQQSPLGAIRRKILKLLERHHVLVVKPLAATTTIVRNDRRKQRELSRRRSPRHECVWDLFQELVFFTGVFPHPRLTIEIVLCDVIDQRGPLAKWTWRRRDRTQDRVLDNVIERQTFRTNDDLLNLLPETLAPEFTTAELAAALQLPRWWAQKIAYVLRKSGALEVHGKRQRSWLYAQPERRAA